MDETTATTETAAENTVATETTEPTIYTAEQVAEMQVEWQSKLDAATKAAKKEGLSEAERLAQLSESERLQEQLKALQDENAQYKQAENHRALEAEAAKVLATEKLPADFAKLVMADDAEGIRANITTIKTAFDAAVQAEVEARLKGKTPTAGGNTPATEAEQIKAQVEEIMKRGR